GDHGLRFFLPRSLSALFPSVPTTERAHRRSFVGSRFLPVGDRYGRISLPAVPLRRKGSLRPAPDSFGGWPKQRRHLSEYPMEERHGLAPGRPVEWPKIRLKAR